MGLVVKALDLTEGTAVAVKVIRPERRADPRAEERFRRETAIARGIDHPNICRVLDAGRAGDVLYVVMEYLEGLTVQECLEARGPLPWQEVCRLGAQLAAALEAIHRGGIVHRDVKPQNVMIVGGRAVLMDFGVAYHPELSALTSSDRLAGTVAYFSPEQARGVKADSRADIYALGLVLFEMTTGRRAPGDGLGAPLALRGASARCRRPSELVSGLPPGLDAAILRCLEHQPRRRFPDAAAVAAALAGPALLRPRAAPRRLWMRAALTALGACSFAIATATGRGKGGLELLDGAPRLLWASARGDRSITLSTGGRRALCGSIARLDTALAWTLDVVDAQGSATAQAWTTAQVLVALDRNPSEARRWDDYFGVLRMPGDHLWRKYPRSAFQPHVGVTAWVLLALARMGQAASPADLDAFLGEQAPSGAWPIYSGAHHPEDGSSYATAMALLALHEQGRLAPQAAPRARAAIARGTRYLLAARQPAAARWRDYPEGQPGLSVSALVLHTLHAVGASTGADDLEAIDRQWLDALPADPPPPRRFEASNRMVHSMSDVPLQSDDTRYYELPWCLVATLDAYPAASLPERLTTLRWLDRAFRGLESGDQVRGDTDDAWIAAELLIALKRANLAAGAPCRVAGRTE
jgi:hypothetical protein